MTSPAGPFIAGAGAVLKRIPPKVWLALAVIAALIGGYLWVEHKIHQAYAEGSKAGHAAQFAHDQAEADRVRAIARQWKQRADAEHAKITQEERASYDKTVAANRALADALRLRVSPPIHSGNGGGGYLSSASSLGDSSGRPEPQADARLAGATATVPAEQLITYAEQCDDDHAARITVEDQWKRLQDSWPKARP
jgi:hypothetical protein